MRKCWMESREFELNKSHNMHPENRIFLLVKFEIEEEEIQFHDLINFI